MIAVEITIQVACPFSKREIIRAVELAAQFEKKIASAVEINIIGDRAIQTLNRRYRGLNKPTDVLSFSWNEDASFPSASLGQIYLSYPQIVRQARRFKVPPKEEFYRMLTHGLLHLVGYDHEQKAAAQKMFALQEKILKKVITFKK